MSGAGKPLLATSGLTLCHGRRAVVSGVDLTVRRGEVVALLGPNGAGKSTLLAGLVGLHPPTAGEVRRRGRVALGLQTGALARRSVQANVEAALAWWGVPRRQRGERALAALAAVGAADLAGQPADRLSGGERRRVHLARSVALQADVLLLDEPFANLDAAGRDALLSDAATVLRAAAGAVVVVVHDRAEAWGLADRLVVLLDGVVAADGPPDALLSAPPTPHVARFLGYTGQVATSGELLLARTRDVQVDPAGPITGTVTGRVRREDGTRVELTVPGGRLTVLVAGRAPDLGARISVRLDGGVRFPASGATDLG